MRLNVRLNVAHAILAVIILLAVLLRTSGLGALDFGADEILHVYAAKEIMEGRPPILPSGVTYERALPYTRLLATIGNLFGLTEWTARLPSVFLGVLTVIVVYVMGRAWYSKTVGLTAAFLIALAPSAIAFSQEVRMYAAFQLLYLLTIFLFMRGLEPLPRAAPRLRSGYYRWHTEGLNINPLPLIASGVFFFAAYKIHALIVPAMLGPLAYVTCIGVLSSATKHTPRAKYGLILAATALTAVVTVLLRPEMLHKYLQIAAQAPTWAEGDVTNWKYYLVYLNNEYPVIFSTLAFAAFYAFLQKTKVTLFLVCCLGAPLVLHSFVLAWKVNRYIFHLLPIMYILWATGFSALVFFLHATAVGALTRYLRQGQAQLIAGVLVAVSVLPAFWMTPWFYTSKKAYVSGLPTSEITPNHAPHPHWKAAMTHVRTHASSNDIIIASFALLARHYGPPLPAYHLNNSMMDSILRHNLRDGQGRLIVYTSGAPVINDLATLRAVLANHRGAWLVTERWRFYSPTPTPVAIQQYIEAACQRQTVTAAPDMMIWYCGR